VHRYIRKAFVFIMAAAMVFTVLPPVLFADDEFPLDNAEEAYSESVQADEQSEDTLQEDTEDQSEKESEVVEENKSEQENENEIKEPDQSDEDSLPLCFSVIFDENGGSGVMDDCEIEADTGFLLPDCQFTAPENMEFDSWEIDGESYQPGEEYALADDIVVMAVWKDAVKQQTEADNGNILDESESQLEDEDQYIDMTEEIKEEYYISDQDMPYESDELFEAYIQREFDKELYGEVQLFGRLAGDRFDSESASRAMYDSLKSDISKIASGEESSTVFTIADIDELIWTEAELGCTIVKNNEISDEARMAVAEKFEEAVDVSVVMMALMYDNPYELYWFDKTEGYSVGYRIRYQNINNTPSLRVIDIEFSLSVIGRYKGTGEFTTDTTVTSSVSDAVANAKTWVEANANKSDRDKLDAYRQLICDEVSYDSDSLGGSYSDAWQLINVFDEDPDTNVVCEGYSKAFQYLCDLSDFDNNVLCYSVSGEMQSDDPPEHHMWNIVSIDDENYLVDVTNCDNGTIGADKKLFLVTGPGKENNRVHTITVNTSGGSLPVVYTYNEDQADLFCDGYLALYQPKNDGLLGDVNGNGKVNVTDILWIRQHILKKRTLSEEQLMRADVNEKNGVNVTDILWIRQKILGKRDSNYNLIS